MLKLSIQTTLKKPLRNLPQLNQFKTWIKTTVEARFITPRYAPPTQSFEITIRIVGKKASAALNSQYRNKNQPTNILSFAYDLPDKYNLLIGDLVICWPVVQSEAKEQNKTIKEHCAHLVVHGVLHLLKYDHKIAKNAEIMEQLETKILKRLNIQNPYMN